MYKEEKGIIYAKSLLYKDNKKMEELKKTNNHLTIMHYLQENKIHQESSPKKYSFKISS